MISTKQQKTSIQIKLLSLCLLLSAFLTFLFTYLLYNNAKRNYQLKTPSDYDNRLTSAMTNINNDYVQIIRFCRTLSNNDSLDTYLNLPQTAIDNHNTPPQPRQDSYFASLSMVLAHKEVSEMMIDFGISDMIVKCIITSRNHDAHLILGNINGHKTDFSHFERIDYSEQDKFPAGIIENDFYYAEYSERKNIIPITQKIYSDFSGSYVGDIYIAISGDWIIQQLDQFSTLTDHTFLIKMHDKIYQFKNHSFFETEDHYNDVFTASGSEISKNAFLTNPISSQNQSQYVVTNTASDEIILALELKDYSFDITAYENMNVFLIYLPVIFCIIVLFYLLLNRMVKNPVKKICVELQKIARGDFHVQNTISTTDEFFLISQEIVNMASNIEQLMQKTIEDEKIKQNYQFKMLQSQINPHFLYNTLNSIRWMGEINGIPGIVDMTSTFSRLLRQSFKNSSDLVTLRDELDFIKNYEILQSYRFGNSFQLSYDIRGTELYDAQMIKFTLQPLVENAMFHGIRPTKERKTIVICAEKKNQDLFIYITDNGNGIEAEKLLKLNQPTMESGDKMSGIGIHNINQRIKIEYGNEYGINIESKFEEYTQVIIRLPFILIPKENEEDSDDV